MCISLPQSSPLKKKDKREMEIRLTRLWKDYGRIKRYPKHSPALLDDILTEIKSLYVGIDDIERISRSSIK